MKIYIIGNPIDPHEKYIQELDLYLHKKIDAEYPQIQIIHIDPTESFIPEPGSIFIDAVKGLETVSVFHSLDFFVSVSGVSVHDYDLYLDLMLLSKAGKLPDITIIGIPYKAQSNVLYQKIFSVLEPLLH
jgi:hypothetical protein